MASTSSKAPRRGVVQFRLLGSLAVQVVVAVVTASIRLYSPLAFGFLVPVYGLGMCGLWGARYGTFDPRPVPGAVTRGSGATGKNARDARFGQVASG